jgi:nitrate/nitrite transport system substrate-binding protein
VTQNNVPTPMYLLAALNLDAQAISVSNEYKDLEGHAGCLALKAAFARRRLKARR